MDGFAVDDPGGGSIRVPGPKMLPEMMLRCAGVPGADLALVSACSLQHAHSQDLSRGSPIALLMCWLGAHTPVCAQTNKAFVSPGVFHELSGGQLDCYVEYSGFIFLVGCARH